MKLFADENVARAIVEWLRGGGHDILYAAEAGAGISDAIWLAQCERESRRLLTSDKDFGELVFRDRLNTEGVILLRIEQLSLRDRIVRLEQAWPSVEVASPGRFLVITESKVRVREINPK